MRSASNSANSGTFLVLQRTTLRRQQLYTNDTCSRYHQTARCFCRDVTLLNDNGKAVFVYYCRNAELQAKITNRSFQYAAPCLWNELPIDLREPRQTQSPSLSLITHGSSPSSSSPSSWSPLASSLTRSVFHSELKTWLFGKSFPP